MRREWGDSATSRAHHAFEPCAGVVEDSLRKPGLWKLNFDFAFGHVVAKAEQSRPVVVEVVRASMGPVIFSVRVVVSMLNLNLLVLLIRLCSTESTDRSCIRIDLGVVIVAIFDVSRIRCLAPVAGFPDEMHDSAHAVGRGSVLLPAFLLAGTPLLRFEEFLLMVLLLQLLVQVEPLRSQPFILHPLRAGVGLLQHHAHELRRDQRVVGLHVREALAGDTV
mmetsp:Transcript_24138/g.42720  ORF Transcript_24138/g.42720 Transcript_24138/m.42720 type:complete len:221 (-) Transcript_24138:483-1145(-)